MNKETTIFIDTQDMEERYGEQLYQEYLEKENKQLKDKVNQLEMSIATKDNELLQLKEELRQLKTNRDEAINEIKKRSTPEVAQLYIEILERGKE